jgi:hypothetical protein
VIVLELLRWQWDGYPRYHRSAVNLLIHIVAVPLFMVGNVALVGAIALGSWSVGAAAIIVTIASLGLQGRGHRVESMPPEPFTSLANGIVRILAEQWVTFPRFVISGGWQTALKRASSGHGKGTGRV